LIQGSQALRDEDTPAVGPGTEIAALFRETGLQKEISELCGHVLSARTPRSQLA